MKAREPISAEGEAIAHPRRGREGRSPRFLITMTEADLDLLSRLAAEEGMSMSAVMVRVLRETARRRFGL